MAGTAFRRILPKTPLMLGIKEKAPINGALFALPDEAWSSDAPKTSLAKSSRHEGGRSFLEQFVDRYAGHEWHWGAVRSAS